MATTTNNTPAITIGISGACGRMGRAIIDAARTTPDVRVGLLFMPNGDTSIGKTIANDMPPIADETALASADIDVLIDFTAPTASLAFSSTCAARKIGMVIGTTGFSEDEKNTLRQTATQTPILIAQNMSVGVNVLYSVAAFAARQLRAGKLGGGYDIEIIDAHHRHKKDAPSGTALRLGESVATATGGNLPNDAVFTRHGRDETERSDTTIGFSVVRGGDIVGEHRIIFAGTGEQLEITHRSTGRQNYATGAICAARFVATADPAFYDGMDAVMNG